MSAVESIANQRLDRDDVLVLVDDDETVHLLVERLLRRTAQQFTGFTDPERALHWLRSYRPAYLLVDFRMPRLNGLELLQALNGSRPAVERTLLCSAGRADAQVPQALPGLSVELIEKRNLFDRERFLPTLGIKPLTEPAVVDEGSSGTGRASLSRR